MAINPETQYPGKVEPATPANPFGTARNITTPGDGTGTPWESAIQKDNWAFQHAMLLNAGMEPNGTPDVADNSQLFKAAKASIGNGANLLSNHNFLIASPDDSQPPPDATPRSYPPGFQIFSGVFANETSGITNLTYVDGRVSFSGGDFYMPVVNTGAIKRVTDFVASVADFDGRPRTRGVSFALVGDEYRVTVGVDALEDAGGNATPLGSVKFEQGSVATKHIVNSLFDIYGDPVAVGYADIRGFGAVSSSGVDNYEAIQGAINFGIPVYIPYGTFAFGTQITNPDLIPIFGPGRLLWIGASGDAFVFGARDGTAHQYQSNYMSNIWLDNDGTWTTGRGGVCLHNCYGMNLTVSANGFERPFWLIGDDRGCAYNNFVLERIQNGKAQITLNTEGSEGFVNQNTFTHGRLSSSSSSEGSSEYVTGIEFINNTSKTINNNVFLNLSVEVGNTGSGFSSFCHGDVDSTITANQIASANRFFGCRSEGPDYIVSGRDVSGNTFEFGFSDKSPITLDNQIIWGGNNPASKDKPLTLTLIGNDFNFGQNPIPRNSPVLISEMSREDCVIESAQDWLTSPSQWCWYTPSTNEFTSHQPGNMGNWNIEISSDASILGVLLDVTGMSSAVDHRRTIGLKAILEGAGGRMCASLFTTGYDEITDPEACSLGWNAARGYYRLGADMDTNREEYNLQFNDEVGYVFIGMSGGSASAKINQLSLHRLGEASMRKVTSEFIYRNCGTIDCSVFANRFARSDSIPTASVPGSYPNGMHVQNERPSVQGSSGSQYVVTGWTWDGSSWNENRSLTGA